jgi:gluconolactonase
MLFEPEYRFVGLTVVPKRFSALFLRLACITVCALAMAAQGAIFEIQIPSEFNKIVDTNIQALTTNASVSVGSSTLLEGPVWIPGDPGYLVFSAFNNNSTWDANGRLKKLVLPNTVSDYLSPAPPMGTVYNGNTLDMQERMISCQSGSNGLRVVMITNNTVVTLVDRCNNLQFYSPNDVVVKSDGTIWFTDPQFNSGFSDGRTGFVTGHNVYRFDPTNGNATCTAVINFGGGNWRPNGLCFSPDESIFYLADWNYKRILTYTVSANNTLSSNSTIISIPNNGNPDGIRCDADGRIYSSSGSGIYIFMPYPDCRLIGRIITPALANLCFGGPDRKTLFITANPSPNKYILSLPLKVTGAVWRRKVQVTAMEDASLQVKWPWPSSNFVLQASSTLEPDSWTNVTDTPSFLDGQNVLQITPTNSALHFRLQIPTNSF